MASEEPSRESEPTSQPEQDQPKARAAPRNKPEARAEIVLRKHRICPYLGLRDDRTVVAMLPTPAHACFARKRRYAPSIEHQIVRCLSPNYPGCSIYPDKKPEQTKSDNLFTLQGDFSEYKGRRHWLRWGAIALALLLLIGALVSAVARGLLPLPLSLLPAAPAATAPAAAPAAVSDATETPTATLLPTLTSTLDRIAQVAGSTATNTPRPAATATPSGTGELLALLPSRGDVGWWASGQTQPGQIGDSFLYAGVLEGQAYVSAVRFDLRRVPRGADIRSGMVRLTGLRADRLDRSANSSWMVQLISEGALPELAGASFFAFFEAPVSFDLAPTVESADVDVGRVNEWMLDSATRGWLFQQLLDGATSITIRIIPLANAGNALFAWDSGHGSESNGAAPQLILSLGPTPPTPPPTPTRPFVVATLTPTPENVMTVVALTPPTAVQAPPTNTPVPPEIVTPTPVAMDLPAVQTAAVAEGRPPVLLNTPVPANAATATTNAAFATAMALTTGTFTPVPTSYVTPVLYFLPPPPENVATAAARALAATAAVQSGTPTPTRPSNAVDVIYVYATETPANQETAVALIVNQNRVAVTTGTPTPTPWNLFVITRVPEPTATPIPLFIPTSQMTPTATPTATRVITDKVWEHLRNKILFRSNQSGTEQTWVMEPATGQVTGMLTDERIHEEARARFLAFSPDGKARAVVLTDGNFFPDTSIPVLQIKIEDLEFGTIRQITNIVRALAYDPAWSPRGDRIAFVATTSGGDELYTIPVGGGEAVRLTFNTWEWDKHPTWSPDGSQIAFFSNRESGRRQIWLMNADGSEQQNLSNNEYEDWDPVWVR